MRLSRLDVVALTTQLTVCINCDEFSRCSLLTDQRTRLRQILSCEKACRAAEKILPFVENVSEEDCYKFVVEILRRIVPEGIMSLDRIVSARLELLKLCAPWLEKEQRIRLLLASLGLEPLSAVLLDPEVEDVYISDVSVFCMKTGQVLEILRVPDHVRRDLLEALVKLAQLAGYELSLDNPTATYTLRLETMRLRITVDVWPVSPYVTCHIRKLHRVFSLDDLIALGTITRDQAEQVLTHVKSGGSILIAGPPGSGKTTLLIALDLALPREVRRVYIDEFDEFPDVEDVPQLKFRSLYGRVREIENVLVRGGGVLIVGELRSREHFDALKLALTSGLQVLATIHARTIDELRAKLRMGLGSEAVDLLRNTLVLFMETRGRVRVVREIAKLW